jgi:hypothetical protein
MKLRAYLDAHGLTLTAFAQLVGTKIPAIHRYTRGAIPPPEVMARIWVATGGCVAPNDFYELPPLVSGAAEPKQTDLDDVIQERAA